MTTIPTQVACAFNVWMDAFITLSCGHHEMSLSSRYQNRGHFYIILGQCTELCFVRLIAASYRAAMYVTDSDVSLFTIVKQRITLGLYAYMFKLSEG